MVHSFSHLIPSGDSSAGGPSRSGPGSPLVRPWPGTAGRHTIRWGNIDVQVISDVKLCVGQRFRVIGALLARTGHANLAHSPGCSAVRIYDRKVKVGSLAPGFRIDVTHQGGQFPQRGIHPRVDLQLIGRDTTVDVLVGRMVPSGRAEHPQQQGACLEGKGKGERLN